MRSFISFSEKINLLAVHILVGQRHRTLYLGVTGNVIDDSSKSLGTQRKSENDRKEAGVTKNGLDLFLKIILHGYLL